MVIVADALLDIRPQPQNETPVFNEPPRNAGDEAGAHHGNSNLGDQSYAAIIVAPTPLDKPQPQEIKRSANKDTKDCSTAVITVGDALQNFLAQPLDGNDLGRAGSPAPLWGEGAH